jgi:hypothetical protein
MVLGLEVAAHDRRMDLDADSVVHELLRRARLDTGEVVPLEIIPQRLGLTLVVTGRGAMHGTALPGVIVYDGTARTLAHELAHYACALARLPMPHDERFVASVGSRLVTPAAAFRRAINSGHQREALGRLFGVSQTCTVLRKAELTGQPAAIVTPTTIYARGDWECPPGDTLRAALRSRARWFRQTRLTDDPRRVLVVPR